MEPYGTLTICKEIYVLANAYETLRRRKTVITERIANTTLADAQSYVHEHRDNAEKCDSAESMCYLYNWTCDQRL